MTVLTTILTGAYAITAEAVAVFGVIEIGPNLLSAITATIGACVILLQGRTIREARSQREELRDVKRKVGAERRESDQP